MCVHVHVIVLREGANNNNNNTALGGKHPSEGGVPNNTVFVLTYPHGLSRGSPHIYVMCVCDSVCVCVHVPVVVLGRGANNNNNNTVFGGKRPSEGGVPNKRHSHTRRDTEKETQTNMLWE